MMIQRKIYHFIFFKFCFLLQLSYQQDVSVGSTTTIKDLTFCIKNHTMSNTLQTFWHDAQTDCEMNPKRLIKLYSQLKGKVDATKDHCGILLQHQIRKQLIKIMCPKLEEGILVRNLSNDRELKENLKEIQKIDLKLSQFIWERVLSDVHLFVDPEEIMIEIMQLEEKEIQIMALQLLFNKFRLDNSQNATFLPLLTFHVSSLLKKTDFEVKNFKRLYRALPRELRLLYESRNKEIGLLNSQHFEYLYAPRDNGPDSERRLALTWSQEKNSTDSDGHLLTAVNSEGLVAIGSRYGLATKYMYPDYEYNTIYFWIGAGSKSNQWWQVLWSSESYSQSGAHYLMFKNNESKKLLCCAQAYDENRRYVTLLIAEDNLENSACHWLITSF